MYSEYDYDHELLLLYARCIETLERKIEMKEAEKNEVASAYYQPNGCSGF